MPVWPPARRRPLEGQPAKAYTLTEASIYCQRLAVSHYQNFTVACWLLARPLRRHVCAVYAFCRYVDDLGDKAPGDRLRLLDDWQAELALVDIEPTARHEFEALADFLLGREF